MYGISRIYSLFLHLKLKFLSQRLENIECPHVNLRMPVPTNGLNTFSACLECQRTEENWICLSCYEVSGYLSCLIVSSSFPYFIKPQSFSDTSIEQEKRLLYKLWSLCANFQHHKNPLLG